MNHLGNPCIHCGAGHDDIQPGPCPNSGCLAAKVREREFFKAALVAHKKAADETVRFLEEAIANRSSMIMQAEAGLDLSKIAIAQTILHVTDFSKGGSEREDARKDAIKWFATGKAGYRGLKYEYFGTKSYAHWHGQRSDHEYGYGPAHGSTIFSIGLVPSARNRELTEEEKDCAIYYLLNLERIQESESKARCA